MSQNLNVQPAGAERAELARVVDALARWPRLSQLLQYMGEKLFAGQTDQLNEYNIATEVLGRSKTLFNAGEDAIARVETHRLRKRLAEFYAGEGKDHLIQVTLPTGSYVPVFIHKEAQLPGSPEAAEAPGPGPFGKGKLSPQSWGRRKGWVLGVILVLIVLLGAYLYRRGGAASTSSKSESGPAPVSAASQPEQPSPSSPSTLPIRILAGYSGPPRTDSAALVWHPDRYYTGGGSWRRAPGFIGRTSDPFLFDESRTGDFVYSIPLKPGVYELHLFFSTPIRATEGTPTFNVAINGEIVLKGFDINADALGENIADERVFRDVSPGTDGFLQIGFSGATVPATLNAIEILPGIPHAQLPVRMVMQTTPFTDHLGRLWHPDNYFLNGRLSPQTHPLQDSSEPDLFAGERYGHFTYAIPVDTRGTYTIVLHFAEFYFGVGAPGGGGIGSRVFKVMCNGQTLLDDFDIYKEVGGLRELTKTFRHIRPSPQGKLNLTFEPIVNNATVSGIEVLDENR